MSDDDQQHRAAKRAREIGGDPHEGRLERGMKIRLRHQHGGNRRDPCRSGQEKKFVTQRRHHRCNSSLGGKNDGFKWRDCIRSQLSCFGRNHAVHLGSIFTVGKPDTKWGLKKHRPVRMGNNRIDSLQSDDLAVGAEQKGTSDLVVITFPWSRGWLSRVGLTWGY